MAWSPATVRGRSGRPAVSVLGWTPIAGRAAELAAALGGEGRTFFALGLVGGAGVPVRYAIDAVRTAAYLVARRPRAVIVMNPPIFPALLCLAYARVAGARVVLDSHPSAFGLAGDRLSRRLLAVHAWVTRHVATTLVSAPALAAVVRGWGGRADVLHEAPPAWRVEPARLDGRRPRILFPGVFAGDEPVAAVVEAARLVPEADVVVTGDRRRCPPGVRAAAPPNVTFAGFLAPDAYVAALAGADVVISLSTEPTSVMRTAHEAVWAGRPLIVTDRPDLRELFPGAVHVGNDGPSIAAGIREALARHGELAAAMPALRAAQQERWARQLATLESRLAGDA